MKVRYKVIQELAQELIQISKIRNEKYPFREGYLNNILKRYETNDELYKIHLTDLPPDCILEFNRNGYTILDQTLSKIKQNYGLDALYREHNVNFYSLKYFLESKQKRLTVKKILSFLNKADFGMDVELLEREVISIGSRKGNKLKIKGLPIDLTKKKWAIIFGIILDTWPRKFNIKVENKDFERDILKGIKNLGITPTLITKGKHNEIVGHAILGRILSLAGINIMQRQLITNNPIPLWIFNHCNKEYHSIVLSKILDTEGHSNKNKPHIRIAQSSLLDINEQEREFILKNSKKTTIRPSGSKSCVLLFSKLNKELKERVLDSPSLTLLSIQLLLRKYKINSTIYPTHVYISNNNLCSIGWQLSIHGLIYVARFYENFGEYISIPYKKENILNSINLNLKSQPFIPKNLRPTYYLLLASYLEKKKGYFNIKEITEICDRKHKTIYNDFGELIAHDYILKIGKQGKFNNLKISPKGKDLIKDYPNYKEFKHLIL